MYKEYNHIYYSTSNFGSSGRVDGLLLETHSLLTCHHVIYIYKAIKQRSTQRNVSCRCIYYILYSRFVCDLFNAHMHYSYGYHKCL